MKFRATQTVYAISPREFEGTAEEILKETRIRGRLTDLEKIQIGSFKGFMGEFGRHWEVERIK